MSEAPTSWYCDMCGKKIASADEGYVIWKANDALKFHSFRLIHKGTCDPRGEYSASTPLDDFVGDAGLSHLLSFLSYGVIKKNLGHASCCDVADIDEFVDLIRRLQTPHYEEARRKFQNEELKNDYSDANQVQPYLPKTLEDIVRSY